MKDLNGWPHLYGGGLAKVRDKCRPDILPKGSEAASIVFGVGDNIDASLPCYKEQMVAPVISRAARTLLREELCAT